MASTNFVDYVKIYCRSGAGGAGSAHLHRDNWTAKGGPDGEMVAEVVISTFVVTVTIGPLFT